MKIFQLIIASEIPFDRKHVRDCNRALVWLGRYAEGNLEAENRFIYFLHIKSDIEIIKAYQTEIRSEIVLMRYVRCPTSVNSHFQPIHSFERSMDTSI